MRYEDRLRLLGLDRLELRRLHFDLVELFKTVKKYSSQRLFSLIPFSQNTRTRGHRYKLFLKFIKHDVLKYNFIYRCIPAWNALPDTCINTNVTNCFKSKLCKTNLDKFLYGML